MKSVLMVSVLLVACGGQGPSSFAENQPVQGDDKGATNSTVLQLQNGTPLDEREVSDMELHPLDWTGKGWKGVVEGASPPGLTAAEHQSSVAVSLGTKRPLECMVYGTSMDGAGALEKLISLSLGHGASFVSTITNVIPVGTVPAVYMQVPWERGDVYGEGEFALFDHPEMPVICYHDEVGYHETFKRVTSGLFKSIVMEKEGPQPQFSSLWVQRREDQIIGVSRTAVFKGEAGVETRVQSESRLWTKANKKLFSEDVVQIETTDDAGRIQKLEWVRGSRGEIRDTISVQQNKDGNYHYKGTFQNQAVSGSFTVSMPNGMIGQTQRHRLVSKLLRQKKSAEVQVVTYQPDLLPSTAQTVTYLVQWEEGVPKVILISGDSSATITPDEDGLYETIQFPDEDGLVEMRRIAQQGKRE